MTISESRLAYEDCYDVMQRALEKNSGVRVGFDNFGEATFYRMRMNQARQLDRRFNRERYPIAHPMHGRSEYDALMFRIREQGGKHWVYADRKPMRGVVEEITEDKKVDQGKQVYRRS
jgi:hypothetical protein